MEKEGRHGRTVFGALYALNLQSFSHFLSLSDINL